ncbi:unnamed protein product [Brassica rapa subsp. narinosa]
MQCCCGIERLETSRVVGELMWVDMLMISVVKPQPGDRILNACAAPGGKTLFMAYCLKRQGRLRILGETAKSHQVAGLYHSHSFRSTCLRCELILFEADLRLNCKLEDMEELKILQDELLDSASNTCSIDPEENQGRVEAFLLRHHEFSVDLVDRLVPSSFVTSQGVFLSNPVKHSLDGAFAASLVRAL